MPRPATHHDARRRELVAAAQQVFIQRGYRETTVSDLLEATGMSKGGFYHYFQSKDDVLRQAITTILDEAATVVEAAAALNIPPTEQLTEIFDGMRELRRRHADFIPVLTVIIGNDVPARAFSEDVIRTLAPPLARVTARFPVSNPRQTAELLLDALTALTRNPYRGMYRADPDAAATYAQALRELIGGSLGIGLDHPALENFGT
ncbi:AcrR family transcriptional regulator [Mycolicibacterium sp. BK634]|uniref:TetR/AcrR family transcriptional regulator n=1 Tax=Mycolicibacterium sp. BK634 TaxID=2587099 RepID=UPI001608B06C|nr:TetR/AcrR family transcriptional regulator [Mycolicibacterium sp. BK634]MBB3753807.1 AcrR family transcriptional regulator [Mycolicibacterium sp. BK634]